MLELEPKPARAKFHESMWTDPYYVAEYKYDGCRYLMHIDKGVARFTSRRKSVKDGMFVEKTANFHHLNKRLPDAIHSTILDGEMVKVHPNGSFGKSKDVTRVTGSLPERALRVQQEEGFLRYYVFDILFYQNGDLRNLSYKERRVYLREMRASLNHPSIHLTETITERKKEYYQDVLSKGGEGIILKHIHKPYGEGWVKCKKHDTYDVVIMGYKDAKEMTEKVDGSISQSRLFQMGWIGSIVYGQYDSRYPDYPKGKLVEVGSCSGMSDAVREELSRHPAKYIGSVMEIEAQERYASSALRDPRFVRFRKDKNASDCIIEPPEIIGEQSSIPSHYPCPHDAKKLGGLG